MIRTILLTTIVAAVAFVGGCGPRTENIDVHHDTGPAVMGLDYRDFDQAAADMVESLVRSSALKRDRTEPYVVTTGRIVNDTMQRIDTDQLMAKVEQEMMNSGQVVMTSAVGGDGPQDEMIYQARELRYSDEFDQANVPEKGQIVAPELSISGKIIQRNVRIDRNRQQVEYYFQLYLTDLNSGLRFWQNETFIGKRGSSRSVAW